MPQDIRKKKDMPLLSCVRAKAEREHIMRAPLTVNLMIHGNVGTGTSFEDSKAQANIQLLLNGNTTHSDAQSKFSGGSIYFDGTGDYLECSRSSADFDLTWNTGPLQ